VPQLTVLGNAVLSIIKQRASSESFLMSCATDRWKGRVRTQTEGAGKSVQPDPGCQH